MLDDLSRRMPGFGAPYTLGCLCLTRRSNLVRASLQAVSVSIFE